ncbi:MAG: DUF4917 family protein [Gemmatimonadetes bacterium]|nr:DUF4917 family protein [Gemmatimonadota bacterium]
MTPEVPRTYKEKAQEGKTLLDLFGKRTGGVPLCITEGSSEQKLAAIRRSDYLQFALHTFSDVQGPIVVFGHSLGDVDRHIVDLLAKKRDRLIAISVYPSEKENIVKTKAFCRQRLPNADLHFFDSTSHPLGTPDLSVPDDASAQSVLAG